MFIIKSIGGGGGGGGKQPYINQLPICLKILLRRPNFMFACLSYILKSSRNKTCAPVLEASCLQCVAPGKEGPSSTHHSPAGLSCPPFSPSPPPLSQLQSAHEVLSLLCLRLTAHVDTTEMCSTSIQGYDELSCPDLWNLWK